MSKTKEEILKESMDGNVVWIEGDDQPVFDAMDTYAQQNVNEFKEKLKAKLMADILFFEATELTDIGSGRLAGLKKAHNYIDEL